jgi:SAM-dependent methyltransferase
MPENDAFWDFYWETCLQAMENLGKREAILAASRLIRRLFQQTGRPLRLLELGCGEGQIVGTLADAHAELVASQAVIGVDYNPTSLARCRRDFPGFKFVEGDFTDRTLLASLGKQDVVLLVNALHEVFSAEVSPELGEVDIPAAKQRVVDTFAAVVQSLVPGGWIVLFDGLEPAGDPDEAITIRFLDDQARQNFETFTSQYQPFRITYQPAGNPLRVTLSRHDFTRYITKSIFLGKHLWVTERFESYQYFTEQEFRDVLARSGLELSELRTLTVNAEKWRRWVEIETPGVDFPQEHILILAQWVPPD